MSKQPKKIWQTIRKLWEINPITKIKQSKKKYNRKKSKQDLKKQLKKGDYYV